MKRCWGLRWGLLLCSDFATATMAFLKGSICLVVEIAQGLLFSILSLPCDEPLSFSACCWEFILLCFLSFRRKLTVVACPFRCSAAIFVCALLTRQDQSSAINSSASVCQYSSDASATGLFVSGWILRAWGITFPEWASSGVDCNGWDSRTTAWSTMLVCPHVAVAFGTVCSASDCSSVVNSIDLFSCYRFRYQGQEVIY